ncbi:MAG: 3-oxoacyl-ACP synthase III [Halobacteriovoraceae bacterium]|jgi:acyl-CoA:acyl-CoA alkyltransferase|nr:3-oxoacyl-ACP synthase III [Halobacteriovoraceae bacterium]
MNKLNVSLMAIDYVEPDEFISSDFIEKDLAEIYDRLKLPYGRIEMQTGIKTRGIYKQKKPSDISIHAAKKLFDNNEVKPSEIDLLIHASVCRDFLEPSTASVVHHGLGLRADCQSFDLSNACLGVVSAITVAASMINSKAIKTAMIVTGENSWPLLEQTLKTIKLDGSITRKSIKKYFANFTIGSAGVALVLGAADLNKPIFGHIKSLSDTESYTLCQGDGSTESLVMETNSELLMQKGVTLAKKNWQDLKLLSQCQYDHYICHQVGIHHQEFLYKSLELDISKDHSTFKKYGNTGSAALPLTLAIASSENKFAKNDQIALLGIGSGLHTIMMELLWN